MKRSLFIMAALAAAAYGQDVVSARAGLINHVEGDVTVDGNAVVMPDREKMFSNFPEVKKGSVLVTKEGRAEVLLSPGVVIRLGEDASLKMISSSLSSTEVELVQGGAVLEVAELLKENTVTIRAGQGTIVPRRTGTYRIDGGENAQVMVYDGSAEVTVNGEKRSLKKGNALTLANTILARKFDTEKGDALLRWSMRRSSYIAMANVSSATTAYRSGWTGRGGGWMWNPYFGMYTYLPYSGLLCSGFTGICYYSPSRVYQVFYQPRPAYSGGGGGFGGGRPTYTYDSNAGYTVASQRSYGGYSPGASVSAGAPAASSAPVADSGGARSSDSGGGRGGDGGGRSQ